jgi:bacterioferritin-associated ferredoxin
MYVCVCNGIKDTQVKQAANSGVQTVGGVFKAHGCKPECAQCVNCIRTIIKEEGCSVETLLAAE